MAKSVGNCGEGETTPLFFVAWDQAPDFEPWPRVHEGSFSVPTKTQLSNFLGTPGEDYFKGNPKSLNFYFLVIWWGKFSSPA